MKRWLFFLYGVSVYSLFFLTFVYLVAFIANLGVPRTVDVGPAASTAHALVLNLLLIALFGLQHSIMARQGFKRAWTRVVPPAIERSTYLLATCVVLVILYVFWLPIPATVWDLRGTAAGMILTSLFWLGLLFMFVATFLVNHFDLFGLRQVYLALRQREYVAADFRIRSFYRFVRHPIYTGTLIAFWATAHMTLGHLLFAAGMALYVLIAVRYEERDLVDYFGEEYRAYQRQVSMLIPRPVRNGTPDPD